MRQPQLLSSAQCLASELRAAWPTISPEYLDCCGVDVPWRFTVKAILRDVVGVVCRHNVLSDVGAERVSALDVVSQQWPAGRAFVSVTVPKRRM